MSIADQAIKEHGEKHVLVVNGDQTIDDVTQRFYASGYPEGSTWVVASLPEGQYSAIRLSNLGGILAKMGDIGLTLPLSALPLKSADAVIPQNTSRSTGEVLDWVADTPGATLVITNAAGFVGLLTNPTMGSAGGLISAQSYLELHGELAKIKDKRVSAVPYPRCPHCGYNERFYTYNLANKTFTCQKCGKVTEEL
jgi:hypothetical protein